MACSESRYSIRACYTRHYVGRYLYYARMVALRLLVAWVRLPGHAYVSDNYSNASQIGTGFILSDPNRPFRANFSRNYREKRNRGKNGRRLELWKDRKRGREQSRSLEGIERKMAVNSGTISLDTTRNTIRYQSIVQRNSNLAALVIQIEQCPFFFFFFFFHRPPTYVAKD